MKVRYENDRSPQNIKARALALYGNKEASLSIDAMYEAALAFSLALCGRDDVTENMEMPIAIVLYSLLKDGVGKSAASMRRGDVAVTYAKGSMTDMERLFAPFIRLRGVK